MVGWDLKSESVFLLCALQCQSTHCNLPKVAAIYAIKHVFNIPEPHCVCVFLAHSLIRSLPLTLSCLSPLLFFFYLCVSVCVRVCPYGAAAFSLFTEGSSLPLRDMTDRKWEFTLAYLSQKKQPRPRSCRAGALFLLLSLLHFATTIAVSHPPPAAVPPMVRSFSQVFRVELGGQELWSGLQHSSS